DIRGALRGQPQRQRPLRNRVLLYVRPVWDIPTATWRNLAHSLAPQAADLGLEKVVARIRMPDEAVGEPQESTNEGESVEERGVRVRLPPPSDQPIQPLTEYQQKALRAKRLAVPYPYEIIRMLTPPRGAPADFPAGDFTEYDLSDDGTAHAGSDRSDAARVDRLVPAYKPYGRNNAGLLTA